MSQRSTAQHCHTYRLYTLQCDAVVQVVSAALLERKVAGSIPTIGDFHTVRPSKEEDFACLATDVK